MKIDFEDHDRVSIVSVLGELSVDQIDSFRRGIQDRLDRGVRDFVLRVDEMTFIDSAGLEALLWLQDSAAEELGQVRLVAPSADVSKILEMTRLSGQFETHGEVTDAVRSLR
ncbi:MAG: STAS domain-containing protein [Phycisphaerales bacterium]